jgi:signal transduction histidine kinase/ligand-binding sensor domain-containing protein/DNA-binding response OmpR family regulator
MIRNALVIVFALFTLPVPVILAQMQQVKFRHLNTQQGLSHPEIRTIFKDKLGFIWVGTAVGLNRFDGLSVKSFFNVASDSTSLKNNVVSNLFETPEGYLGVSTSAGLCLYHSESESFENDLNNFCSRYGISAQLKNIVRGVDGAFWFVESDQIVCYRPEEKKTIIVRHIPGDSSTIVPGEITDLSIDPDGSCWIVHSSGIVEKIDVIEGQGRVTRRILALHEISEGSEVYYKIMCDSDGDLWFCAPYMNQGVFYYTIRSGKLLHLSTGSAGLRLNTNTISGFLEANDGAVWIATDHGGINIVDKETMTIRYVYHEDGNEGSIAENSITCSYKDDQGIIWLGTYKRGVSYYHDSIFRFDLYRHNSLNPGSLPFEDINRFAEDDKGNLWIGTNGGGLLYFDRQTRKFRQYVNEPGNENSLSGNVIVSLCLDSQNNLWIGTYRDGLNKFDGKRFKRYKNVHGDDTSLPSQNVWEIFEDSKKRLWIGTLDAGAALLDKTTGEFHKVGSDAIPSTIIESIAEDRHGNIWFGTIGGIDIMSADGATVTHHASSPNPNSLSSNNALDITRDSRGRMWIATSNGLNLFDESINGFRVYRENSVQNNVLTVLEDNSGHIWMSTLNGLSEMTLLNNDPGKVTFKRYNESDGLQGRQFNPKAAYKTSRGEIVFGGPTGFNIFRGDQRKKDPVIDRIFFSDLEVYENPVAIGEKIDGVVVLDKSISLATEVVLPPGKNFFSIKLSALNYFTPDRDQYFYQLEGLNTDWLPVDTKNRQIVLNGLNPGEYKLRIKASNGDGVWSLNEAVLAVIIQPPFWKTGTAVGLYILLLSGFLFIARKLIQQREKLKFAFERERREIQRIRELDLMKVKFFTNVSHEFRTPLTLILAPIERLIKNAKDPDQVIQFQLIQRNGKRLMKLVNQLLDFKKLEVRELQLSPTRGDIISFTKETVFSFSELSEKKSIKLVFNSSTESLETLFDQDKLEKILFNLLSNAFKFTLEGGVVSVNLELLKKSNDAVLQISVKDTGIGVPGDKLGKIFEPFFQTDFPKSIVNNGSGIGLSITKELVRIHGGRITVDSELGKGSCFKVTIPVQEIHPKGQVVQSESSRPIDGLDEVAALKDIPNQNGKIRNKSLLLVEDNDDFRFYLKDNLKYLYNIHEARNGVEGWNQALSVQPDLIVSDIMMPEMNGLELCMKVKSDERVSHMPVILLTAHGSDDQRLEGFKTGADDYITKPVNFEVLEARISNLLRQREKSQKSTPKPTVDVKSNEIEITPLDVRFIENAVKCVEKHVSSSDFSVEDLGTELGISRAYVFKKILALTGKTPLEFIRTIRLQHAAQLLEKSQLSVREVAFKVGFNNPKYFTKYFKEQFQMLPSDYAASKKAENK